jgi:tetratricopeptide (TPR) repeat protein
MLPPSSMLTIKNWVRSKSALFLAATLLLAACAPPGPRALLQGQRLLEQGKSTEAIEKFKTATVLLATNAPSAEAAQAWNYLGVAYHQAGQAAAAEHAYLRAQALDKDLTEAHFNLGCLWLEQNRYDGARAEFTSYTLRRSNDAEGFVKLGTAELHASETGTVQARTKVLNAAENSFKVALQRNPQSAEALNGLGLVRLYHNQPGEAVQFFSSALKQQPAFAPALLNLAIVAQQYLNQPQVAIEKYRAYLALKPVPANAEAVRQVLRQLEPATTPPARPAATPTTTPAPRTPAPNGTRGTAPTRTEPAPTVPKTSAPGVPPKPAAVAAATPAALGSATPKVEAVKLAADPPIKPAQDGATGAEASQTPAPDAQKGSATTASSATEPTTPKRSLFQRLFGHAETSAAQPAALPAVTNTLSTSNPNRMVSEADLPELPVPAGSRYTYRSSGRPLEGNRPEAQRALAQGVQAQGAGKRLEAIKAYRTATQLDPGFFDAYYNLGAVAAEAGELRTALAASENALALKPESRDARYNFALALTKANYFTDAANELEKLLAYSPNEVRAHLAVANLYAQQLRQPAKARPHYQRVLDLDPRHKQADNIRYWLVQNK